MEAGVLFLPIIPIRSNMRVYINVHVHTYIHKGREPRRMRLEIRHNWITSIKY